MARDATALALEGEDGGQESVVPPGDHLPRPGRPFNAPPDAIRARLEVAQPSRRRSRLAVLLGPVGLMLVIDHEVHAACSRRGDHGRRVGELPELATVARLHDACRQQMHPFRSLGGDLRRAGRASYVPEPVARSAHAG